MHGYRRSLVNYVVAVAATAVALFVRWLLDPLLDHRLPFITLYGAVAVAVWVGGWRPALLAAILGYVISYLAFIEPEGGTPLSLQDRGGVAGMVVYLLTCLIVIGLGNEMRTAKRRSEAAALEAVAKQKQLETEMIERRRTEGALQTKEAELELVTSHTPLLLTRCSKDLRYVFVNPAASGFLGRKPEEVVGRPIVEVVGQQAFAAIQPHIERVLRGEQVEFETEIPYAHSGRRFMHATYTPDRNERGDVIGWVASVVDVSERKRTEDSLRESEERYRLLFDGNPQPMWVFDRETLRFLAVNQAAVQQYGYSREEFLALTIKDIRPADQVAVMMDYYSHHGSQVPVGVVDRAGVWTHKRKDGTVFEAEITGSPISFQSRNASLVMAVDVTDRKRAEQTLRDNEARQAAEADALGRLNELSSRLWRMRSLREGLEEMLAATIELLGADRGNVQILDADRGVLAIAAHQGFEPDFLNFFREVSTKDDSACGRGLRSGARIVIEDVEADAPYAPLRGIARAAGYRAVQSTPLISRDGAPLGMLSTHWRSVHRPSEQDLRRLDLYVRQAADFIERCRTDEVLREADRRKDEFLATLAHELRNPLAPVRNAIQILHFKGPATPELQWARDVIDRQMQQMTRLVDDLIDVSRITRGKLELRKERVELARVLQGAVETSRPLIDGAGHALTVALPSNPVYLDADLTRLAQVFSNLLNNAAKYSDRGGRIWLAAERQGSDAVVSVRDTGIGIPKEMLPRIFDMFTQVDRSWQRAHGGLGIGLTLVKRLVEMHGGSVAASSDGPGKGSEFVVRLPIPVAHRAAAARLTPDDRATPAPARYRVLVVDDNNDAATSLSMLLNMLGYEMRTAFDGMAGLEAAAAFRPDFVLLDIGMPKLNGCEVARRIRAQPWGKEPVLIAVTGWGQAEDKQRIIEAGFDHHLVKPVDPTALASLLALLVREREAPRANRRP
jgi:PAS domain S-box-containing protein